MLSHIEFLKQFLEQCKGEFDAVLHQYITDSHTEEGWTAEEQRLAALRASQNGGKLIIQKIFWSWIDIANDWEKCQAFVDDLMAWAREHVGAVFLDEVVMTQGVLVGHFPHVSALNDAAKARIQEEQHFELHQKQPASSYVRYKRTTDLLYAVTMFAEEMTKKCRIPHVMAGTRFTIYEHLLSEDKTSRGRLRFPTFSDFRPVTVDNIRWFFNYYFGIPKYQLQDRTIGFLCGRPSFLFDVWFRQVCGTQHINNSVKLSSARR